MTYFFIELMLIVAAVSASVDSLY